MANYPAGWNDPPALSYSESSSAGKRNLLNKRVPFPLNPSAVSSQPDKKELNNLTSSNVVPENSVTNPVSTEEEKEDFINLKEEELLPFINDTFKKILEENSDTCEKKRIEEINHRLKMMNDSWNLKISSPVKQKMFVLAKELSKGNAEAALKIQCALMVDHLREVKQWMVGVKHIIEMERQKNSS